MPSSTSSALPGFAGTLATGAGAGAGDGAGAAPGLPPDAPPLPDAGQSEKIRSLDSVIDAMISYTTYLGVQEASLEQQHGYLERAAGLVDAGVASMIETDIEAESARAEAMELREQLALQALSIANARPAAILQLLR